MLSITQALILGLVQGFTELFPISSLGHSVILPGLVGWNINQNDAFFLTFLVATHFATAIVLFLYFWKDWLEIIKGIFRSIKQRKISAEDYYAKLGWLLVVGTVPAGLIGLIFQDSLRALFSSTRFAAFFLMLNGILLYGAEVLRRRTKELPDTNNPDANLAKLNYSQAFGVGTAQVIALIPGFSRSGATMAGSLFFGLSHKDAARYSFLLATPIIAAAAVLKLPDLFWPMNHAFLLPIFLGAICAAATSFLSIKFLLRFFETNKLTPFAIYCASAGLLVTIYLSLR